MWTVDLRFGAGLLEKDEQRFTVDVLIQFLQLLTEAAAHPRSFLADLIVTKNLGWWC